MKKIFDDLVKAFQDERYEGNGAFPEEINRFIREYHQEKQALNNSKYHARRELIEDIIIGRESDFVRSDYLLRQFQIYLLHWKYCLVTFRAERTDSGLLKAGDAIEGRSFSTAMNDFARIATEIIQENYQVHTYRIDLYTVACVRLQNETPKQLAVNIKRVIDTAAGKYDVGFSAAISDTHEGIEGLQTAFLETAKIYSHHDVRSIRNVYLYCDEYAEANHSTSNDVFMKNEALLLSLIINGQLKKARETLDKILEPCKESDISNVSQFNCRIMGIADKVIAAAESWADAGTIQLLRGEPLDYLLVHRTLRAYSGHISAFRLS